MAAVHHAHARALMRRANRRGEMPPRAAHAYARAIAIYRRILHGQSGEGPEHGALRGHLADALFASGRHGDAADEYALLRASTTDPARRSWAALRVVQSLERVARAPLPERAQPRPTAVPADLRRLMRAREIYLRWVAESEDTEGARAGFAIANARALYLFGHLDAALTRTAPFMTAPCAPTTSAALALRRDIALARGDIPTAEVAYRQLARCEIAMNTILAETSPAR